MFANIDQLFRPERPVRLKCHQGPTRQPSERRNEKAGDTRVKSQSASGTDTLHRRRRRLTLDYQTLTHTWLAAHSGKKSWVIRTASKCFTGMRRQFLPHYFSAPPRWRVWIRKLRKKRVLPDFCIIGPVKSGTSDLAVTIMAHPNVMHPLVKEFSSTDPLTWPPHYPTAGAVKRHIKRHGMALCPLVGPYLHCHEVPITLSALRPNTKIIIALRDPVDLMFSMWKWRMLHNEKQFIDRVPFLASFPAYVDKALDLVHETPGPYAAELHCGIYALSVAQWLRAFGMDNVCVLDVAGYFKDRNAFCEVVENFLGLPTVPLPPRLLVANRNPLVDLTPDPGASARLREYFYPYNRRLWPLIGTEYSW